MYIQNQDSQSKMKQIVYLMLLPVKLPEQVRSEKWEVSFFGNENPNL